MNGTVPCNESTMTFSPPSPTTQRPGTCLKKDPSPVQVDESWNDSCKDDAGKMKRSILGVLILNVSSNRKLLF